MPAIARSAVAAPIPEDARILSRASLFILAATVIRMLWLASQPYPLYGDEAQYWTWAQALDWGYYSKPPMIAWIIALTTKLAGDNEFGVRVASPLCHAAVALLIADLGRRLFDARTGAWSGVIYVTLPAVSLSSMLISTDVPLLLFWTIALVCLVRALDEGGRWWIGLGIALGLGLLSKYAMALFVPSLLLYLALSPKHRSALRNPRLYAALALGIALYLPNLGWNIANGFVSYRHTGDNANLHGALFHPDKLAEFLGSQFGVFGPLLFGVLLVLLVARLPSLRRDDRYWLLAAFALPQLGLILIEALLSRANANWTATAYVTGTILVVAWCRRTPWLRRLIPLSLGLHLVAAGLMLSYHDLAHLAGIELTRRSLDLSARKLPDPASRLKGWNALGQAVGAVLLQNPGSVLMTEDRMLFAEMAFYVWPRPTQVEWNWDGKITDQYELVTDIAHFRDAPILFLSENPNPQTVLAHFAHSERLSTITIPLFRDDTGRYTLFALQGFKG